MPRNGETLTINLLLAIAIVSASLLTWTLVLLYRKHSSYPISNETIHAAQHPSE